MIAHFKNSCLSLFISLLTIFFQDSSCVAQGIPENKSPKKFEKAEINWISQWPSIKSKENGNKRSILDLITGKKKQGLSRPVSMVAGDQNAYWILDQENNAILQVKNGEGKTPHFIEKMGYKFSSLVGICDFHNNEILVTDSYLNKIFLINSKKKECAILNDSLKLNKPTGIAYSQVKNEIWLLETGAHRILVLNEKGEIKKTIGSRGTAKGEFNFPTHIWIDAKGNAYVVDAMNFRIQVLNKEGEIVSVFGTNGDATGYFASPKGIATDSYGHIYIVDALFHAVQIFDIDGNFLYSFGSQGQANGQFWIPSGIYIDRENKIYVSDSYNSRIQAFQLITEKK